MQGLSIDYVTTRLRNLGKVPVFIKTTPDLEDPVGIWKVHLPPTDCSNLTKILARFKAKWLRTVLDTATVPEYRQQFEELDPDYSWTQFMARYPLTLSVNLVPSTDRLDLYAPRKAWSLSSENLVPMGYSTFSVGRGKYWYGYFKEDYRLSTAPSTKTWECHMHLIPGSKSPFFDAATSRTMEEPEYILDTLNKACFLFLNSVSVDDITDLLRARPEALGMRDELDPGVFSHTPYHPYKFYVDLGRGLAADVRRQTTLTEETLFAQQTPGSYAFPWGLRNLYTERRWSIVEESPPRSTVNVPRLQIPQTSVDSGLFPGLEALTFHPLSMALDLVTGIRTVTLESDTIWGADKQETILRYLEQELWQI